jgi:hypothetical protein
MKKTIVSFDFDGVLHQTVKIDQTTDDGTILSYTPINGNIYNTNPLIINKIYEEASKHELVIITARSPKHGKTILQYIRKLGLAKIFKGIYFCPFESNCNKIQRIQSLGVIRHYEDSPKYFDAINKLGNVELIKIYPLSNKLFTDE